MDPPNRYMPTGIDHSIKYAKKKNTRFSDSPDKYFPLGQVETLGYEVSEISVLFLPPPPASSTLSPPQYTLVTPKKFY